MGFMMYFMIVCREGQAVNRILFKCAETLLFFIFVGKYNILKNRVGSMGAACMTPAG